MRSENDFLARLGRRLSAEAPGLPAQLAMAPKPRVGHQPVGQAEGSSSKAGVMLLLYPKDDVLHLVLIRRTLTVMHHRDQIGLPGGQVEGSETFEQAALRETWEELGIEPGRIRILGRLTPLYIPVSNFCVYPVVGVAEGPLAFVPDTVEAAEAIEIPLDHLLDAANIRMEDWVIRDTPVEVPFYAFGPHKIWGATAMVLAEFVAVLKSLGA